MKNKDKRPIDRKTFRTILKETLTSSLFIIPLIILIFSIGLMILIFMAEKDSNPNMTSMFDALWYTFVTITTVGYGDISPVSVKGRFLAFILILIGVVIFGAVSGKITSLLFDRQQKKDRGLLKMQNIRNHFLILGWKPDFERILKGILEANPEIPMDKVVLLNDASANDMDNIKNSEYFKGLNWVKGDFTDEATLLKAQIKTAERVLILGDSAGNYSSLEIDSRTVLAVITIKNLNPRIYCVAEIINSKFEKHLSLAHCDEIILSQDYELNILFQASAGKGMSHILRELISEETDSELLIEEIPEKFVGKTYGEYKENFQQQSKVPLGLLENTGNFYQRRNEALAEAQKNPDMKKIVSNLKAVKTLKSNLPNFLPADDYIIPNSSKAIFICRKK